MNVKMAVILPLPQYVKQALCVSVYQAMKHKYQHTLVLFYPLQVSTRCVCHKHLCVFIFQSLEPFRYVHNRMQQSGEIRTHPLQTRHMSTIVFQNPGNCLWNSFFRRTKKNKDLQYWLFVTGIRSRMDCFRKSPSMGWGLYGFKASNDFWGYVSSWLLPAGTPFDNMY